MAFFEGKQAQFFRPLYLSTREKYACALKAIFEVLEGPETVTTARFDRRALLDTVERAMAQAPEYLPSEPGEAPVESGQLTPVACASELEARGWLETHTDPSTVSKVWRLTPMGKRFARQLWELEHPTPRTRHRNMRSCAASLAAYAEKGDPDDLLNAQHYAEQVREDLNSVLDAFHLARCEVLKEAHQRRLAVEQFIAFVTERFRKDIAPMLEADSPTRLKSEILDAIELMRGFNDGQLTKREAALREKITVEGDGFMVLRIAERIGRIVFHAVDAKIPELLKATHQYTSHMMALLRQSAIARHDGEDVLLTFLQDLGSLSEEAYEARLAATSRALAPARVRLYDPRDLKIETARPRDTTPESPLSVEPDPQSVLEADIRRLCEEHLAINDNEVLKNALLAARSSGGRVRLSQLAVSDARELLYALATEASLRSFKDHPVEILELPSSSADTLYFSTPNLEFVFQMPATKPADLSKNGPSRA